MCNKSEQGLLHRSTTNHERVESRLDKTMVGLRPTLSTTNCANQSPASATCPRSSFSIFTPGRCGGLPFLRPYGGGHRDRIHLWPGGFEVMDSANGPPVCPHPGSRPQIPISGCPTNR